MSSSPNQVLVIGAGVVGIACAHYLHRAGLKVALIDQAEPGQACSFGNCGLICPSHILPLTMPGAVGKGLRSLFDQQATFRIKPQARLALYRWLYQFARRCTAEQARQSTLNLQRILDASMAEYRGLLSYPRIAATWREGGTLCVFRSEHALQEYEASEVVLQRELGVGAELLDAAAINKLTPGISPHVRGGVLFRGDAFVQPDQLTSSWLAQLKADGVTVLENTALQGISVAGPRIKSVATSKGDLTADQYVFALGSWSPQLKQWLGVNIPIEPGKGYSVLVDRPVNTPSLPVLFPERNIVATPFAQSVRLGSIMEFAGYDGSIPEWRVNQLIGAAADYIEMPVDRSPRQRWTGWRPMTWDSLPIIGRPRQLGNALIAAGHNMLGMTLAPATGRLIADLAMERAPFIDSHAYSPDRFG
ncbi:D-amino-acid dehydrogenase [Povalibacter uvarum]|uniref:D-amino-acid dehydrogenase n=1 Tax=Povalibacter uvarum TaxID=732238 RepID=A0A841HG70_9GAMM|nr:FAD-dependent oxidoreductase [Povalibacter uvarum]MBB6091298.1 D-amino-acid dehydrogenase [Povalibacter uvarum]